MPIGNSNATQSKQSQGSSEFLKFYREVLPFCWIVVEYPKTRRLGLKFRKKSDYGKL